jgi:hypothetical protein
MRHVRALLALFFACALLISGFPLGSASPVAAQEGDAVPVTDEAGAAVGGAALALLSNGQVLSVGGARLANCTPKGCGSEPVASAELYTP